MVDIGIFTVGARIEIRRSSRPHLSMGHIGASCMIPTSSEVVIVRSKRMTKNGLSVHFVVEGETRGYKIDVEKTDAHTFHLIPHVVGGS